MKNQLFIIALLLFFTGAYPQAPQGFNYQAVIRDSQGQPLANQLVSIKITLQDQDGNSEFYSEIHDLTTSPQGTASIVIGNGVNPTKSFEEVPWDNISLSMKIEVDSQGGDNYSLMGTANLQAVPYALYALTGATGPQGPEGPQGPAGTGLYNKGAWVSGNSYGTGDYVFAPSSDDPLVNSMWIAQTEELFISTTLPADDLANWIEFQAPQGEQGPEGPQGPEGTIASGELGQTLLHDGTTWVANSNLFIASENVGIGTTTPSEKLEVAGNIKASGRLMGEYLELQQPQPEEDPIFVVRNSLGQIVFAVYESGVRIYVEDEGGKSTRGGFAVGGLSDQTKADQVEYLRVTPDSVRINIKKPANSKATRGGFAVGGLSDQTKSIPNNLLFIAPDSARIYINDAPTTGSKATRGGFAVGGLSNQTKAPSTDLMFIARDSARIYVNSEYSKGTRGGFAVGGLSDQTKNYSSNFLYLTPENYFIGQGAGANITTGSYNSFMGYQSGYNNTEGNYNAFLGYRSGYNNLIGQSNLFLGYWSGYSNTSGSFNTFVGYKAGSLNTTGGENTFVGSYTGTNNTEGSLNSFVGYYTGYQNTTGEGNSFFGNYAGYANTDGYSNVFLGNKAGYNNIEGYSNVYIGDNTGYQNTYGNVNVYIGNYAGYNANNDWANVFIGYMTGYSTTNSQNNVFIGNSAGKSTTWGAQNVYIGVAAGFTNVTGSNNVAIGVGAGQNSLSGDNVFIGYGSGFDNTSGASNVFIGNQAGFNNTTGGNNVYLGVQAGYGNSAGIGNVFLGRRSGWGETGSDRLVIENNYTGSDNAANALIYGNFNSNDLRFNATIGINTSWSQSYGLIVDGGTNSNYSLLVYKGAFAFGNGFVSASDATLKRNVQPLKNALDIVKELRGVSFYWDNVGHPDKRLNNKKQIGMLAQDVEKVLPEIVVKNEEGYMGVAYDKITAVLVEAIKEQQQQIQDQKSEIEQLKAQIQAIQAIIGK